MMAGQATTVTPVALLKFVTVFAFGGTERQFVNLGLGLDPSRVRLSFGCLRREGPRRRHA